MLTFDTTPLAAARRRLGLSQEAVAEAAGVSVRTVQHVESGDHKPRVDNLAAIAGVLGVNPALLFVHAPEVAKTSHGAAKKITRGGQAGKPSPAGNATGA